jgi:tRNA (guanine37-N1)-methyltransferase
MQITILTLFPGMFNGPFAESIVKRAREAGKITIRLVNIRNYGQGKHQTVDDTAYGGGIGMVMRVDVLYDAITANRIPGANEKVVLLSASGRPFVQSKAREYSTFDHLMLICGHYEGIDERILTFIDEEITIGDFVVTGGEIPAMLITDAVVRLLPGVLKECAITNESFSLKSSQHSGQYLIEYPQFTKPPRFKDLSVPEVLLSGDHKKINAWREQAADKKTRDNRPDLLADVHDSEG